MTFCLGGKRRILLLLELVWRFSLDLHDFTFGATRMVPCRSENKTEFLGRSLLCTLSEESKRSLILVRVFVRRTSRWLCFLDTG